MTYSAPELQRLHGAGKAYKLRSGAILPTSTAQDVTAAITQARAAHGTGSDDDDPGLRSHLTGRATAHGLQRLIPATWSGGQAGKGLTELASFSPTRVDLVGSPANGVPVLIMKARAGQPRPTRVAAGVAGRLVKTDAAQRFTLCVAYPADRPDVALAADGHRDFAGKAALEAAAWDYLVKSPKVGLWHEAGTDGAGDVVESHIHRAPDWSITAADGTSQVVKQGDWLLGIRWSPDTWPLVRDGHGRGVSMQGTATRRAPSPEALEAIGKAAQYERQAAAISDPVTAQHYRQMAARLREQLAGPAGHLAKAEQYEQAAGRVADPRDRSAYTELAAAERRKAGVS